MNESNASTTGQELARVSRGDAQSLLLVAVEKGANVETLERLMALAKEVREVTAREAWNAAMAEFQQRCPTIKKDATARIPTRSGNSYSYNYATLDSILAVVAPILGEHGLSVSWRSFNTEGVSGVSVVCRVSHKLGHHEDSGSVAIPIQNDGRMNPGQAVGSALTYAKRYSLMEILGIAPEDDDDLSSDEREEGDETTGLVAEVMELWRDMRWTRAQVKQCLRDHHISDSLADARISWSGVDVAAITELRDDMRKAKDGSRGA